MDDWKQSFAQKLHEVHAQCGRQFESALGSTVAPVFEELQGFLNDNGFKISCPLRERDRRSFKFELAENAYVLMIFRFFGVGAFELRTETFVPGTEPILEKKTGSVLDMDRAWAERQFQTALDRFADVLVSQTSQKPQEEPVAV